MNTPSTEPARRRWNPFRTLGPAATITYIAVAIWIILMFIGPSIGPYGPEEIDTDSILQRPGSEHWLGTDRSGMDIFSRILAAPRVNLFIAITAVIISIVIGFPIGALAGYIAGVGRVEAASSEFIMRSMDVLQAFPVFIFALALVAVRGPSTTNVIVAMAFVNIPPFVRLGRAEMLTVRELPYADAARVLGHSGPRIVFRHLLRNSIQTSVATIPVVMGFVILFTASLSFVGAGVPRPTPELGSMVAIGATNMVTGQWWPALFPGIALGLIVLSFAFAAQDVGLRIRAVKRGTAVGIQPGTEL